MITFREMTYEDLEFFLEVRNSCAPEYLHDSRLFDFDSAYVWWFNGAKKEYYIIEYDGVKIGYFRTSNYSEDNKNIYIGADLHSDWRGMGLSYVAYLQFIPFMFESLKLHKISLEVLSTNTRAINLYKKLGFVEEGRKREEVLKNGIYVDSVIMSILKDEYEKI
jgi:RimJ/RimL family protein N-acetyltransferase